MMINLVITKGSEVVEYFENIGHYYLLENDTIRLADGTEFGGLKANFYLTTDEYEIGEVIGDIEDSELKEQYLRLTLEQKIDKLNAK